MRLKPTPYMAVLQLGLSVARVRSPSAYVVLVLFAIFYGFFFINFITNTFFGGPLVVF